MTQPPVLVEVERSGVVESAHRGIVVIVGEHGEVVHAWGEPDTAIYPRSTLKPLQAAGMLQAGLPLTGEWLALACASHSGERFHLQGVQAMLASGGFDEADLQCPPDWPLGVEAEREYAAQGRGPARIAMNCSGKHAAMLLTCRSRDWPVDTYLAPEHPLQRALRDKVEQTAGPITMTSTDGCGAPLWGVSLVGLARAFLTLPEVAPDVVGAMQAFPDHVGGTTRDVSQMMRGVTGLVTKDGAEAVQGISVEVDGRRFGVAVKIGDGSDRARPIVAAAVLRWLGVEAAVLQDQVRRPVLGGGRPVGEMRICDGVLATSV